MTTRLSRSVVPENMSPVKNLTFALLRDHLRDIPQFSVPSGYAIRPYGPGDSAAWVRIWAAAELPAFDPVDEATFDREFGNGIDAMPKRSMFLVSPQRREVGTVTAWPTTYNRRPYGMLHWFAIHPDHQGQGLGRCLVSAGLNRLRALGHRRALAGTQTVRLAAVKTYLHFGFVPETEDILALLRHHVEYPALGTRRKNEGAGTIG